MDQIIICKNCSLSFTGKFCNHCGQKNYTEEDKKFTHFAHEIIHFLTHFDGSFLKTVKTVVTKPGKLSSDYCNGKRKTYYKPISFFLLLVVLYILFPVARGLNPEMEVYQTNKLAGEFIKKQIDHKISSKNISREQLSEKFYHLSTKSSKILLLLLIPFSAVLLYILFFKEKRYAFDLYIISTEFNSMIMLLFCFLLPVLAILAELAHPLFRHEVDEILGPVIICIILGYAVAMFRRFFKEKWAWILLKSVVFCAIYIYLILPLYHMITFELTFAFV